MISKCWNMLILKYYWSAFFLTVMTFVMKSLAQKVTREQTAYLQILDVVDDLGNI